MEYKNILTEIIDNKASWVELKRGISKYNIHNLQSGEKDTRAGKVFEIFAKYFFLYAASEEGNFKNVWLFQESPLHVRQLLNLGNVDYGVDLILESIQGHYFVVQCKFKNDETEVLNWSADKIANLFAFCPQAYGYIVFSNAADLDKVSKTRHDKFTFYSVTDLLTLPSNFFELLKKVLTDQKVGEKTFLNPRPHQIQAINNCVEFFEIESRGQLILPCGAGKTLTALWIKEKLECKTTLVLVPSLALLRQIKNDWANQRKSRYNYICVCSEGDIDSTDGDSITTHTYEVGINVTTNSTEIKSFLNESTERVIFSTYHSLPSISLALENTDFEFDLIFCDEAHKTAGIGGNNFSLVHDNSKVPSKRRLYATATPRIVKESLKKKLSENLMYAYDMGDPKVFGEEFFRMTFKNAIEQDILVDYKIVAVGVNSMELKEYIDERRYVDKNISIDEIANNYALNYVMTKYNASHGITFHSRIKLAKEFALRHSKLFPETKSFSVSGEQSTSIRNLVLNDFKEANRAIVSNSRCLTEGVDVPAIDLVYFCDPKNSKVDIVQAVGRALRKKAGKKLGLVVVPIYHTASENVEESIGASSFKNLLQVIRSLCDQDERLQDEINYLAFGKGKKSSRIDIVSSYFKEETETIVLTGFEEKLRNSLFDQIIDRSSNNWDMWFLELNEYIKSNGKYPDMEDEVGLYRWVASQRIQKKNNYLKSEEIRKLNSINFIWDQHEWKWESMFKKLEEYSKINDFEPYKGNEPELSRWYDTQLNQIKNSTLREDRKIRIEEIKFKGAPINNKWIPLYEALVLFRKENPDNWPSYDREKPSSEISKLYVFCTTIRKRYRENELGDYWFDKMTEINFNFEGKEDSWIEYYNSVKAILFEKNTISVEEIGNNAYSWITRHKRKYEQGLLTKQQAKLISELNLDRFFETWEDTFSKVREWVESNKIIPTKTTNSEFNSWLYSQRSKYKNGTLSDEQINKLKSIGFDLLGLGKERNEENWVKQFNQFKEFVEKNNRYPGPTYEKELYLWVQAQRAVRAGNARNRKPLSEEREKLLDSIEFIWIGKEAGEAKPWRENFENFRKHVDETGRLILPSVINERRNELYSWWLSQKKAYAKGELIQERIDEFKKIGIDLDVTFNSTKRDGYTKWANRLNEIAKFIKEQGHLPRPGGTKEENNLYSSLARTRRAFQNKQLTERQLNLLKDLNIEL